MTVTIPYTMEAIATICKAAFLQRTENAPAPVYLSMDSRRLHAQEKTLFLAIRTHFQNANKFIAPLYGKGCRNFMTDDPVFDASRFPEANILRVQDTITALQALAAHHRRRYPHLSVVSITGSNGKTIVKEWLNHLLGDRLNIVRSPRSYNSQSGVPLSVLQINQSHDLAIFEAGISQRNEMETLERMILPQTGVFTNIGTAHETGFTSMREKISEKLKLFIGAKTLIFSSGDGLLTAEIGKFLDQHKGIRPFSWGRLETDDLRVKAISKQTNETIIEASHQHKNYRFTIPFTDDISIHNALLCACVVLVLNAPAKCFDRFSTLFPIAMRLEMKPGINRCTLINDSYSNDLQSLHMALAFLDQQKNEKSRTVILSDIPQSLTPPNKLYKQVAELLSQYRVQKFVGIGSDIAKHKEHFGGLPQTAFYNSVGSFLETAMWHQFRDEMILIKGARSFEFEKISKALEQKTHQTVLNVNLTNLVHNFKAYKKRLGTQTRVMAMVKAFGYGSGSHEIASVLEYNKANYLAVAYADEGVELRKAGISLPILVMNTDEDTWDTLAAHKLEPELFSPNQLQSFLQFARHNDLTDYPVHIKIDTGMHRLGFLPEEMPKLGDMLRKNGHVQVVSAFTHLSSSDDPSADNITLQQFQMFETAATTLRDHLKYSFLRHVSNTAAASRLPALQLDMVRIGIGLYGIDAGKDMQNQLEPVLSLVTTVSQIKHLPAGAAVGYNRKYFLDKPGVIATVRVGYADGYPRALGNGNGSMLVNNQRAPVVGNVCMDMCMLDVSHIAGVAEGDEVTVFGKNLPLEELAHQAGTIPYEIMTGISQRVKRVYFEG